MKSLLVFLAVAAGAQAQSPGALTRILGITPRVMTALGQNRALSSSNIDVETIASPRLVTLRGTVLSAAQKTLAGAIAADNAAGYHVRNELLIQSKASAMQMGAAPQFKRAGEFLRVLAASQARSGADGERKVAFSARDVERISSFVSPGGLTIQDANENGGRPLILSKERFKRDLKRTGSSVFDSFAFASSDIGVQSSVPISFRATPKGVVVASPSGLSFVWERQGAARRLFLRKLQYLPGPT